MTRNILVTLGEDIIARNIFYTDFWRYFTEKHKEDTIILLVKKERVEHFSNVFKNHNIHVVGFEHAPFSISEKILFSLARNAIHTHTNLWSKMRAYERGDSGFVITYLKRLHTFIFGNSNIYKKLLRWFILKTKSDKATRELFDAYKPDIVVAFSLTNFEFDVPVAKEAKRRGIKIIGMVRSWDNFSSHGLMRVVPDVLLLQNVFLKQMALQHQAINPKKTRMEIVGIPHYDFFTNQEFFETRNDFCKRNNLDPRKKIILYLGMGDFLFKREGDIIDILEQSIERGEITKSAQVLYSAHPKFRSSLEKAKSMHHIIPCDEVSYIGNDDIDNNTIHTKKLINLIHHSDVLVMGASTMAIDATVLNKPVICIGFDGVAHEGEVSYWNSVKRFYDTYTHFEALMETGVIKLSRDKNELIEQINEYLINPIIDPKKRKKVLDAFVEPFDGHAAERVARQISNEIRKVD